MTDSLSPTDLAPPEPRAPSPAASPALADATHLATMVAMARLIADGKRVTTRLPMEVLIRALAQTVCKLAEDADFQARVQPWMMACFGPAISADRVERNHRFLEEALELVQACRCTAEEAHQLVEYVYGRPIGEAHQEAGGVMVTLAALCLANSLDMHECGETELARIWTKVEQIRAKQAAKPRNSPLPGPTMPEPREMVALVASRKG